MTGVDDSLGSAVPRFIVYFIPLHRPFSGAATVKHPGFSVGKVHCDLDYSIHHGIKHFGILQSLQLAHARLAP